MTRLSKYAKIIDPNSEYYGQVFKVLSIWPQDKEIQILHEDDNCPLEYNFDEIQFCVTKDNEPVKIGEEYVCIGDKYGAGEIRNFLDINNTLFVISQYFTFTIDEIKRSFNPLHPTNKIKITAEGKEYWVSRDKLNEITK